MLTSDFCVVSDGATIIEDAASPIRAASQLSLDSRDQTRIQNVLATTLNQATSSGFSCYVLSDNFRGDALLKIKPSLNAFTLTANSPEIPIPCITSIIVENALIKKIQQSEFPATDLSLIDGAMGVTFHPSLTISNALVIFNSPDERRQCVALISLLRISPPHRRMAEAAKPLGDSEIYENLLHTGPSQMSSSRPKPHNLHSPQSELYGQSPLFVTPTRPTRLDGVTRSGRPTRTNMARSPLRLEESTSKKPPANTSSPAPNGYFLDHQWRQYRSLSPEQRATMRTGRTLHPDLLKSPEVIPQSARGRIQTPSPLGSRLCEMCMTPPPSRRFDQFDIPSNDRPHRVMTPQPTRRVWQSPPPAVSSKINAEHKLRPPSSSTQTTRAPETPHTPSITNEERPSEKPVDRRPSLMERRFPTGAHPSELKSTISPKSQVTMPIRFYSPMRTKDVRAVESPSRASPSPRIRAASPSPPAYRLLEGDPHACTRAIVPSESNELVAARSPREEPQEQPVVSETKNDQIPVPSESPVKSHLTNRSQALTSKQGGVSEATRMSTRFAEQPPRSFIAESKPFEGESKLPKPSLLTAHRKQPSSNKLRSFTEYFDKSSLETDQIEILTTENTSTVIHGRQLSRHPHESPKASAPVLPSPTILEDAEAEVEVSAPSATDESFDISASLITPSYVKRKTRRQLHKQAASPIFETANSPLSAHDESWRPHDALSPLDKLQLSRIGVPTPFTLAQMRQSESSAATGANIFKKRAPALNASLEWR